MTRTIRSKTVVAIVALIILAFAFGLLMCITMVNRYYIATKERDMLRIYNSISSLYDNNVYEYDWIDAFFGNSRQKNKADGEDVELSGYDLAVQCDELGISVLVLDPSGYAVFTYGNPGILDERLNELTLNFDTDLTPRILESNDSYTVQTVSRKGNSNIEYLEMWGTLGSQNSFICRSSFSGIENNVRVALIFFCFVCAVIVIIAGAIISALSHSYSKPLKKLVAATQSATNMDFSNMKNVRSGRSRDEIGMLGENISEMSQKLEKTLSELKSSNLKLRNELKAKAELDEQRKKYISDISHELKTPIALISGYAEGLKEGVGGTKEDQEYYLDVIIDEAEKMNLMVKRISSLNKLEQGQGDVELMRFNVVEVINGYLNTMALIFDEKGINIFFNSNDIIYVWSDEFLFEEVLMNYVNNALNHIDEHKNISIKVEPIGSCARVTVFNTGKQIPEEELDKVWGEFYKVDKARTRQYGGSGLGLSIVKAIADTLEQKCGVYNTNTGVAFWIDLELDKVQEYGNNELQKRASVKMSDLPIWKTTTKILKDTSDRLEASAKERAEKEALKKEERAEKNALKKEEQAKKEALKKEGQARREARKMEEQKNRLQAKKKAEQDKRDPAKTEDRPEAEEPVKKDGFARFKIEQKNLKETIKQKKEEKQHAGDQ